MRPSVAQAPLRDILIKHDALAEAIGNDRLRLRCRTARDFFTAIHHQVPAAQPLLRTDAFAVFIGDPARNDDVAPLTQAGVTRALPDDAALWVMPNVDGANGRAGKALLGIAVVGLAIAAAPVAGATAASLGVAPVPGGVATAAVSPAAAGLGATAFSVGPVSMTYGQIARLGVSFALQGVSGLLAPVHKPRTTEADTSEASGTVGTPMTLTRPGNPAPMCWGPRVRCGMQLISLSLRTFEAT